MKPRVFILGITHIYLTNFCLKLIEECISHFMDWELLCKLPCDRFVICIDVPHNETHLLVFDSRILSLITANDITS